MLAYHIMVEKQRAAGQLGQTPVQLTPTQVNAYAQFDIWDFTKNKQFYFLI